MLSRLRSLAELADLVFSFSRRRTALRASVLSAKAMRSGRLKVLITAVAGMRSQIRLSLSLAWMS